jgi:uncharacterized protein (UPF0335 family)
MKTINESKKASGKQTARRGLKIAASADKDQPPSTGHNSSARKELLKKYVTFVAKKNAEMVTLRDHIKQELMSAKDDGFSKTAIRKAARYLALSPEQRQAQDEVQDQTDQATELCRDLPLFQRVA